MESGATKSFEIHVKSSYARLDNAARGTDTIMGGTKGEYENTLIGMMIQHNQRERKESGEILVVWFCNSHPDDNKQRVKAELSARVYGATWIMVEPDQYQVGWTTIKLDGTGERTHAIVILAKPEIHATLEPLFLAMSDENTTHTSTRWYLPYPVCANQEYTTKRLMAVITRQRKLLQKRTSVTIVGVPVGLNLFTMTPLTSYLDGEDGLVNLMPIVEILYGATAIINGQVIQSPVHKVTREESGRWKLIGMKQEAKTLIGWTGKVITLLLPLYLVEITRMKPPTISIDVTVATQHAAQTQ